MKLSDYKRLSEDEQLRMAIGQMAAVAATADEVLVDHPALDVAQPAVSGRKISRSWRFSLASKHLKVRKARSLASGRLIATGSKHRNLKKVN